MNSVDDLIFECLGYVGFIYESVLVRYYILSSFFFFILVQFIYWNYKIVDLDDFLKDKEEVVFLDFFRNFFYCIQTGKYSCYGDQFRIILKFLVEFEGNYYLNMIGLE